MCTVLLADDNAGDIEALRLVLEDEGHRVLIADNGCEALCAAERERPDVVITDLDMPCMDGIELCRQMKRQVALAGIPVMVVSASLPQTFGVPMWAAFFRKPASLKPLVDLVGELGGLQRARI
jgi:CheY-like chemotaxis protein